MEITVFRKDGTELFTFPEVDEGSLVHRELGGEHYLLLKFPAARAVALQPGDYCATVFGRYELNEPYTPAENADTGGFDYELRMEAPYMKWKNKICRYLPLAAASETAFSLTSTLQTHLDVILSNVNALGDRDAAFRYNGEKYVSQFLNAGDAPGKSKLVQYQNTDILTAVENIAKAYGLEWWVEDNILFMGKCRLEGEEVSFGQDVNVQAMSRSESSAQHATRLFAFGSARNLPSGYRKDSSADVTRNGVVQKRLMLPLSKCPNGWVQSADAAGETDTVEAVYVDEDIYPRTECVVGQVTTYESTVENEDGTKTTQTFYRVTDTSGFKFENSMILEGQTLHILFQSGSLNGMDFECRHDDKEKYYEIISNDDYGRALPDEALKPKEGDKFVLYNWDSSKLADTGLIDKAEEELYEAAVKRLAELDTDPNTYDCDLYSDWVHAHGDVWYDLGQRVRLTHPAYFPQGRSSRVIGYEIKLDLPYDTPHYTVGEAAAYSRSQDLQQQIDEITVNGQGYQGGSSGGGGQYIYVIKEHDAAIPSDYNVFSAKRSLREHLSRLTDDKANGLIQFLQGIKIGSNYSIGRDGSAVLDGIRSLLFDISAQSGYGLTREGGSYKMYLANLEVWGKAVFHELEIRKLSYAGGDIVLSPSGGTVVKADEIKDEAGTLTGWRCWLMQDDRTTATMNMWRADDQARCQTFNLRRPGSYENAANRYYWRRVTDVSTEDAVIVDGKGNTLYDGQKFGWIVLSATDYDKASTDAPRAGDVLVLDGNRTDRDRQNVLMMMTEGDSAPCIAGFANVNSYTHEKKTVFSIGPKGVKFVSKFFQWISPDGTEVAQQNFRGPWQENTEYYYYDVVTHEGCTYLCVVPEGETTTEEPSPWTEDWEMIGGDTELRLTVTGAGTFPQSLIEAAHDDRGVPTPFTTLGVTARLYNRDVTDRLRDRDVVWTRDIQNQKEDEAWNAQHMDGSRTLPVSRSDLGDGYARRVTTFTATVTYNRNTAEQSVTL